MGIIETPNDDNEVIVFNSTTNRPIYVSEVPCCYFNGIQICLSTKDRKEVPKLKAMCRELRRWYDNAARKQGAGLVWSPN